MFQVSTSGMGGGWTGDGHEPGGGDDFVLVTARDLAQAATETITDDGVADAA
jgi:hypothetical protein